MLIKTKYERHISEVVLNAPSSCNIYSPTWPKLNLLFFFKYVLLFYFLFLSHAKCFFLVLHKIPLSKNEKVICVFITFFFSQHDESRDFLKSMSRCMCMCDGAVLF